MTPMRPYLLRAFYQWITDNGLTPHAVIEIAEILDSKLPPEFVDEEQIVLNISKTAVNNLGISNGSINFEASFSGKPWQINLPISAVVGIYAKENGQGMVFNEGDLALPDVPALEGETDKPIIHSTGKPHLTVVKPANKEQ